ncbi:MAG: hypothetical protein CVT73_09265 [Alphaproteobacteria bacterium HGW-Alphaproteobacteria-12]|nr:MAG: hypothetical protein CVT73_09265 [Alphaproteobacteria bacterium HGW-Alphaproteobacteria-12]
MGISPSISRAILQEHKHKPIEGDILLIGKQSMGFTPDAAREMIRAEGIEPRAGEVDMDITTRAAMGKNYISDVGFFSLFTDAKVTTLDVTDYEGADIVHDMPQPIPESMEGVADFLWIGSCLDNMCDPITALQNSIRMLKPGGRLVDLEMAVPEALPYLVYPPEYMFDFFAINNFADLRLYVAVLDAAQLHGGPWHFYSLTDFKATVEGFPYRKFHPRSIILTYVVAEKGPETTWDRKPVQGQYRPNHDAYRAAYDLWQTTLRPNLVPSETKRLPKFVNKLLPKSKRSMPDIRGYTYIGQL